MTRNCKATRIDADNNRAAASVMKPGRGPIEGHDSQHQSRQGTVILRGTGAQALHDLPGERRRGRHETRARTATDRSWCSRWRVCSSAAARRSGGRFCAKCRVRATSLRWRAILALTTDEPAGEITALPLRVHLSPGKYYVRSQRRGWGQVHQAAVGTAIVLHHQCAHRRQAGRSRAPGLLTPTQRAGRDSAIGRRSAAAWRRLIRVSHSTVRTSKAGTDRRTAQDSSSAWRSRVRAAGVGGAP